VKCIAVLAVLAVFGLGAAPADTPTREEETLLLEVGRRVLRNENWKGIFDTAPRPKCVIYTTEPEEASTRLPVSAWLLSGLRHVQPDLVNCTEGNSDTNVLWLGPVQCGPVQWEKPSTDAYVYYGGVRGIVGRACFAAHKGFVGHWSFTLSPAL
jgi:hypothetical protein